MPTHAEQFQHYCHSSQSRTLRTVKKWQLFQNPPSISVADPRKSQYNESQQNNKGGVFGAEKEKKQVPEDDHHQRLGHDHHYRFRRCSGCPSKFTIDLNRSHLILKAAVLAAFYLLFFNSASWRGDYRIGASKRESSSLSCLGRVFALITFCV